MGLLKDVCVQYRETVPPEDAMVHMVKAGGMIAVAGMVAQFRVDPEHTVRLYNAAVDGMAAEIKKIRDNGTDADSTAGSEEDKNS